MAKILIVEDEAILALNAEATLQRLGYDIAGMTDNGSRAVELAFEAEPDIILMDIALKGAMSGVEAARLIREKRDCRVVFMTAHTDTSTLEAAGRVANAGFLSKPFEEHQLKDVIEKALV